MPSNVLCCKTHSSLDPLACDCRPGVFCLAICSNPYIVNQSLAASLPLPRVRWRLCLLSRGSPLLRQSNRRREATRFQSLLQLAIGSKSHKLPCPLVHDAPGVPRASCLASASQSLKEIEADCRKSTGVCDCASRDRRVDMQG